MVRNLPAMRENQVWSLGWDDPLEKEMASHFGFLPGESHGQRSLAGGSMGSMGSQRVSHNWSNFTSLYRAFWDDLAADDPLISILVGSLSPCYFIGVFSIGGCCPNQRREVCVCVCVWLYLELYQAASYCIRAWDSTQGNTAQTVDWMTRCIWHCHVVGIFVRLNWHRESETAWQRLDV